MQITQTRSYVLCSDLGVEQFAGIAEVGTDLRFGGPGLLSGPQRAAAVRGDARADGSPATRGSS